MYTLLLKSIITLVPQLEGWEKHREIASAGFVKIEADKFLTSEYQCESLIFNKYNEMVNMDYSVIIETASVLIGAFLILIIPIIFLYRRHKNCGGWSFPSGIGGSKYTQYQCKKCKETFWIKNKF